MKKMKKFQYNIQKVVKEVPYIINESTMIILPWYSKHAYLNSTILELYQEVDVNAGSLAIVDQSCIYYGSDLKGRLHHASMILKGQRMLPVLISESNRICMVPTCSPYKPECVWLSYKHVKDIVPKENRTVVILSNNQHVELDITRDALETRLSRAARVVSTQGYRQEQMTDLYKMQVVAEEANLYTLNKDVDHDQLEQ
jgi:competence protein ComK